MAAVIFLSLSCSDKKAYRAGIESIGDITVAETPWKAGEFWENNPPAAKTLVIFSSDNYLAATASRYYPEWAGKPAAANEAGFIRTAFNKGIFNQIIWVTPFDSSEIFSSSPAIKHILGGQPNTSAVEQKNNVFNLDGIPVTFCSVESIPVIDEISVIFADPSFFSSQYLLAASGRKPPSPDNIVRTLSEKGIRVESVMSLSYVKFRGHLMKHIGQICMNRFIDLLRVPSTLKSNDEYNLLPPLYLSAEGNFNAALKLIERAGLSGNHDSTLLKMLVYIQKGDGEEAAMAYKELINQIPGYSGLENDIGDYLFHRNKPETAKEFYLNLNISVPGITPASVTPEIALNIILISVDTLRADALKCCGNIKMRTPNIDMLAQEGILFTSAYCQIPQTGPSHASMLTGKYPQTLSMLDNGTRLGSEHAVLPEILAEKGALTGAVVSGYPLDSVLCGLDRGFSFYDDEFTVSRCGVALEKTADETTERAVQWLKTQPLGHPFFLFVHYYDPHGPYNPPEKFTGFYEDKNNIFTDVLPGQSPEIPSYQKSGDISDPKHYQRMYAAEISFVDSEIGNLIAYIEKSGLEDKTVFILTADHGESMGEHEYYFDHGHNIYQESVKIPLIIKFPKSEGNRKSAEVVETVDIMPTVLDILNIPVPEGTEGESFYSLLKNHSETIPDARAFMTTGSVYLRDPSAEPLVGMADSKYKLIFDFSTDKYTLFDLAFDPDENVNVINSVPEAASFMKKYLLSQWAGLVEGTSESAELSEEDRKKLNSLGYIGN